MEDPNVPKYCWQYYLYVSTGVAYDRDCYYYVLVFPQLLPTFLEHYTKPGTILDMSEFVITITSGWLKKGDSIICPIDLIDRLSELLGHKCNSQCKRGIKTLRANGWNIENGQSTKLQREAFETDVIPRLGLWQQLYKVHLANTQKTFISDRCIICYTEKPNILFDACKHVCLCSECSPNFFKFSQKCPICRSSCVLASEI